MKIAWKKVLGGRVHSSWFWMDCLLLVVLLGGSILLVNEVSGYLDRAFETMTRTSSPEFVHHQPVAQGPQTAATSTTKPSRGNP